MREVLKLDPTPVLRNHRLFESRDVDETRELISGIMQPHRLTPTRQATSFRANMDFVRLHRIGFGTIAFGAMEVEVPELADYHLLILCLRGRAQAVLPRGEVCIDQTRGIALNPGERLLARFSEDSEQFVVRIDRHLLSLDRVQDRLAPGIDTRRAEMGPFFRQLQTLLTDPDLVSLAQSDARLGQDFERVLVSLLAHGRGLRHGHGHGSQGQPHAIAPGTVRRAEVFMDAHFSEPISLHDIARSAGVPARTLQEGFRRFRGTSPTQALRALRLDAVRRRLLSDEAERGVSTIAMECGFNHLSRFAAAYHARFAEWPSATVADRRKRPRVR